MEFAKLSSNLVERPYMIYFDNNATTKIDPRVLEAMMPFLTDSYGNAASNHEFGVSVNQHVKSARESLADLIGAEASEIIFTSGATEAINLALQGVAEFNKDKGKHIVTVASEHPSVLDTCRFLETKGYEITYLPVQQDGLIELDALRQSVRHDTVLISVMFVNNETGVIQPLKEVGQIARANGSIFMTDGTQAVGKIPFHVDDLGIDLMSFSSHKFYGPKGTGGLFVRSRRPHRVRLTALLHGGGHERGFRSGTLNVPGIVGIGKAAEISKKEMDSDVKNVGALRNLLENDLLKIENTFVNGSSKHRLYNVSNICFRGADADAIMVGLKGIMVSNGSACTSTKVEPSHVLKAMGLSDEDSYASIRFSLGRFNSIVEIKKVAEEINSVVSSLRMMVN